MNATFKHITIALLAGTALQLSSPSAAQVVQTIPAAEPVTTSTPVSKSVRAAIWQGEDVALKGRDVVSYFKNDKPLDGSEKYTANWDSTTWQFSSDENRQLFLADPEKYAPQFGGFCPVALSKNKFKVGHVNQYHVNDDKLYLNYKKSAQKQFSKEPDNFLLRAELNF